MKNDISHILAKWPYGDDEGLQVRRIEGRDGRPKLQLRIDLGLMQMEVTGRPDGQHPHGYASLLDYHRSQAQEHRREHGWYEGFELDADAVARAGPVVAGRGVSRVAGGERGRRAGRPPRQHPPRRQPVAARAGGDDSHL